MRASGDGKTFDRQHQKRNNGGPVWVCVGSSGSPHMLRFATGNQEKLPEINLFGHLQAIGTRCSYDQLSSHKRKASLYEQRSAFHSSKNIRIASQYSSHACDMCKKRKQSWLSFHVAHACWSHLPHACINKAAASVATLTSTL